MTIRRLPTARALLCWVGVVGAPAAQQEAAPLARVLDVAGHVAVAPDGTGVAVVVPDRRAAVIVDAATGQVRTAPLAGEVTAVAVLPRGRGVWLGLVDGGLAHAPTEGAVRRFPGLVDAAIDGIEVLAGGVAWSSSGADRGGVLDARDGEPRFATGVAFAPRGGPGLRLSRDGRVAVHFARDERRGGRRIVVVRDAGTGDELGRADCYLAKRDREVAFVPGALFSAARVASSRWELRRLDLVSFESTVVDADLRGGHFVDLFASPDGRYLLEGDFEEGDAALYDLVAGGAPRTLRAERGALPLGFVAARGGHGALALTTASRRRGIALWSVADGVRRGELPVAADKLVTAAGSLRAGTALWFSWWRRDPAGGKGLQRGLDVVALDD